ncbi:MAG TPA: class I SAM-dependent methyltransferase [Deltaproteobacteria bacterium]|nr:class I SAM-dependent methyltransferase [Deltaproteobacteria bacterium]HOM29101.1 class I SAM-dependent methyltransferase [Deltaproteobacteria bacterium]HPP80039.1 class I SAM-dependent methyltransferase [Deltaproteobacteria bacterium]
MDDRLAKWMGELRRFNPRLHLVGPSMLEHLEEEVEVTSRLLEGITEPAIADLGSGSGLMAFVYKALHPDSIVTCVERSVKKCDFLRHTAEVLGLEGFCVLCEDLLASGRRFKAAMARSFSPVATLGKICSRVLVEGGRLYYLSSSNPQEMGSGFRLDGIQTARSGTGLTLNLWRFTRLRP